MKTQKLRMSWWGLAFVAIFALSWAALRYFDHTQEAARRYIARDSDIVKKVGTVRDTTLYKFRYLQLDGSPDGCFAEYYFFVSGSSGGSLNLRVIACGARTAPEFRIQER